MRKYQISPNARKALLASCALFVLPLFVSSTAFAQNEDSRIASIPADNIAQATPRVTLSETDKIKLRAAINGNARVEMNRDKYRHPEQTIEFFGIKPDATVIEIWPGQGWYTSILGPYLKSGGGHLIAANFDTSTTNSDLVQKVVDSFKDKFSAHPEVYGDVQVVPFGPRSGSMVPDGTADAVLTFRNIHNWMAQGWSDKAFDDFYRALKPGGILGIEEHRADEDTPQDPMAADGYVRQDYVISLAKDAGFELIDTSEINANSRDTKDHPFGVWTLPPVLRTAPMRQAANPKFDSGRYTAIGESDRMTLLFRKPLKVDKPPALAEKSGPFPIPVFFGEKKPKKGKSNTKTAATDNAIKTTLNPVEKKAEEANTISNAIIKAPVAQRVEANVLANEEATKAEEVKAKNTVLTNTPSWDKNEPNQETLKADNNIKTTILPETSKETTIVKADNEAITINNDEVKPEIPVLPANIITQDKPTEIAPEVKPTEAKADVENTTKVRSPTVHKKPEVKADAKTTAKTAANAKADKKDKTNKNETVTKGTKGKTTAKVNSKEDAKNTAKGTKSNNSKTSAKTSAKNTDKTNVKAKSSSKAGSKTTKPEEKVTKPSSKKTGKSSSKTDSKATDKKTNAKTTSKSVASSEKKSASKTNTKTDTKAKTTAKPAAKSKGNNVPDWSSPKKHK